MARILLIGSTGAGKTRLALELGDFLDHTVHHLDLHFHGQKYSSKSLPLWRNFTRQIAENENWVMDGNYFDTLDDRIFRATHMIWLDPLWISSAPRALLRTFMARGKIRPDLGMRENTSLAHIRKLLTYKIRRHRDFVDAYTKAMQCEVKCIRIKGKASAQDLEVPFLTP